MIGATRVIELIGWKEWVSMSERVRGKDGRGVYARQRNHQSCYEYAWGSPLIMQSAWGECKCHGYICMPISGHEAKSLRKWKFFKFCLCEIVSDCRDCVCVRVCVCVYVRLILQGHWWRPCVCMFICVCDLYPQTECTCVYYHRLTAMVIVEYNNIRFLVSRSIPKLLRTCLTELLSLALEDVVWTIWLKYYSTKSNLSDLFSLVSSKSQSLLTVLW